MEAARRLQALVVVTTDAVQLHIQLLALQLLPAIPPGYQSHRLLHLWPQHYETIFALSFRIFKANEELSGNPSCPPAQTLRNPSRD